jgi:hypothetical protein
LTSQFNSDSICVLILEKVPAMFTQSSNRFKKQYNMPNADSKIIDLIVGSEKDHVLVYHNLARYEEIKQKCNKIACGGKALDILLDTIHNRGLTIDDLMLLIHAKGKI